MDTCDRCLANGHVHVQHESNSTLTLTFCGHHYTENEVNLVLAGFKVVSDTRSELLATASSTVTEPTDA
jgi:hypothetical protein